jgi:tetratricopeptide (TPR) repeat protein
MARGIPVWTVAFLGFGASTMPALARSCPQNSFEVNRSTTSTQVTLTCRCEDGYLLRRDKQDQQQNKQSETCVPHVIAFQRSEAEIQTLLLGTQGKALKQQSELEKYALNNKKWSPTALSAFLLSTLSAARARFARAQRYLAAASDEFRLDKIATEFGRLLEVKQQDLQSSNYIFGRFDDEFFRSLDNMRDRSDRETFKQALQGRFLAEHGYYEEALHRFRSASDTVRFDSMLRKELHNALLITSHLLLKSRGATALMDPTGGSRHRDAVNLLAREQASAERAWQLAFALNEAGQHRRSAELYREAIAGLQITRPEIAPELKRQLDIVTRRQFVSHPFPPLRTSGALGEPRLPAMRDMYRKAILGEVILDALDYGKGDWKRSIKFLETAAQMDPGNRHFSDALGKVREMSQP